MSKVGGFTLVESIIVIVVMGFAMITISQFLVPQITRSANPHYQTRAAALGQSVMSTILARGFDQYSDFTGGSLRCGEGAAAATNHQFCSGTDVSVNPLGGMMERLSPTTTMLMIILAAGSLKEQTAVRI
ncbi:type II secretion system protein [Vibrio sinaloensis]|nr:type II secretion system protein [Vibrio sinaloensis]